MTTSAAGLHSLPQASRACRLAGMRIHYLDREGFWASKGSTLYRGTASGHSLRRICDLAPSFAARLRGRWRLTRRLFRSGIHHILPVGGSRLIVVIDRQIAALALSDGPCTAVYTPLVGSRPLNLCFDSVSETSYYGEYRSNQERTPVRVLASTDGGESWHTAFTLSGVRHIHGVFADPHSQGVWVTTGDENNESAIWLTTDRFTTLTKVMEGTQQCRAVGLLFTADHVYFGSDSEREPNHLWRLDRRTVAVERLCDVDGSVFWAGYAWDGLCFSTAVEPSLVNRSKRAAVWWSSNGDRWTRLTAFPKDTWPMRLFQYGQVTLPTGPGHPQYLWLTPFATVGDQSAIMLDRAALHA